MRKEPRKSFEYYANIAESVLSQAFETNRPPLVEQQKIMVAAADVYARLAAAAPDAKRPDNTFYVTER